MGRYFKNTILFLAGPLLPLSAPFSYPCFSLPLFPGPLLYCLHRPCTTIYFLSFLPFFISSPFPCPFSPLVLKALFVLFSFIYPSFSSLHPVFLFSLLLFFFLLFSLPFLSFPSYPFLCLSPLLLYLLLFTPFLLLYLFPFLFSSPFLRLRNGV